MSDLWDDPDFVRDEIEANPRTAPLLWRAGTDRVAHVVTPGLRSLCGQRIVPERLAWPETRRCLACAVLAEREAV